MLSTREAVSGISRVSLKSSGCNLLICKRTNCLLWYHWVAAGMMALLFYVVQWCVQVQGCQ